jgi:hypothetical protein
MQSKYSFFLRTDRAVSVLTLDYAITNRLTPFISMQNFHNAAYREEEREMMPTLKVSTRNYGQTSFICPYLA